MTPNDTSAIEMRALSGQIPSERLNIGILIDGSHYRHGVPPRAIRRFALGEETFRTSGFAGLVAVVAPTEFVGIRRPQPETKIAARASGARSDTSWPSLPRISRNRRLPLKPDHLLAPLLKIGEAISPRKQLLVDRTTLNPMSKHRDFLQLPLPVDAARQACRSAISGSRVANLGG